MKRKKKHRARHGGHDTPMQKITGMLVREFAGAGAAQLVTLRYNMGHWQHTEDYYMAAAQGWIHSMNLSGHRVGLPMKCIMDTDWEDGAGAPIHRAVIEQGANALQMARLWVYGTAMVEPLDFSNGFKPVAALLMGDPAAECGR